MRVGQGRWPLSTARFLWDIYDSANDNESVWETYDRIMDNQYNFLVGNANNQRDEPFNGAGGALNDCDGKSAQDYRALFNANYSVDPAAPFTNNCSPPGD